MRPDVFALLHRHIPPESKTYRLYLPHVAAVTTMATRIGMRQGLTDVQLTFIQEATLLHDIGIVKVDAAWLGCYGELPYIAHLVEGRRILEAADLPRHARVAYNHVGLGITAKEIKAQGLPLPAEDILPETIEEQIISWADLFFTKNPRKLWRQRSVDEVRRKVARYGVEREARFDRWLARFGT
jgi:uncharacterized protein